MRRLGRSIVAFMLVLTALVIPGAAWAQGGTLDQSNETSSSSSIGFPPLAAQTFTAGRSGLLDQVELRGFKDTGGEAVVQITAVDTSGLPTGQALGSGSFNADQLPESVVWISVHIEPAVPVTAGVQYAIVIPPTRTGVLDGPWATITTQAARWCKERVYFSDWISTSAPTWGLTPRQ